MTPETPAAAARPLRLAASVILLRDGPCLEVLLLKRHASSNVHAGAHVFPGGKVEASDAQDAARMRDRHPDLQAFARMPVPEEEALQIAAAALRELAEECGIRMDDPAALHPYSRWITPVTSVSPRRFDTWFFLAVMPRGAEARADEFEAVEVRWTSPRAALEDYAQGAIELAPPQLMMLAALARHASAEAACADPGLPVSTICPEHVDAEVGRLIVFPGDPLHSVQAPPSPWAGPRRLVFRQGRPEPVNGLAEFFA